MVRVIVDRCSVSQDDYGDWWLEFYVDDIRHAVLVSDIAAQQSVQPTLLESPRSEVVSCQCGLCKGTHTTLPQSG